MSPPRNGAASPSRPGELRLVAGRRPPHGIARPDAAPGLRRVRRVAADHERPAARVDDQAPLAGLDVPVGRAPLGPRRSRGCVDLDVTVLAETRRREVGLTNVEDHVAESVAARNLAAEATL